jgi:hypothetical protein
VNPPDATRCDCGYDFQTHTVEKSYPPEPRMFDYYQPQEKNPTDYTGLKIVAILTPVFVLITYLANADLALGADLVLGMTIFAVKIRWDLSKHIWFWAIIALILALHVPLILMVRWPQGNVPTLVYTMPIGILDFFIIIVALDTVDRIFSKDSSSTTINCR